MSRCHPNVRRYGHVLASLTSSMFCNPSDGIAYILATVFPLPFHRVAASQKNENKEATNKEKSECESFFYEKKETCKIKTTLKSLKLYRYNNKKIQTQNNATCCSTRSSFVYLHVHVDIV